MKAFVYHKDKASKVQNIITNVEEVSEDKVSRTVRLKADGCELTYDIRKYKITIYCN